MGQKSHFCHYGSEWLPFWGLCFCFQCGTMAKIGGDVMESIGERIAEARKSLSLSQAELARRMNVTRGTVT